MNSQDLSNLQEAYLEVYQLDEDRRPIYGRGGAIRKTETPLQIYKDGATEEDKRTKHNIPKGGTTIDNGDPNRLFTGDYDRGSGNAAKRRAAALTKPEAKKFPNRLTRSDKQGIKDSYDLYDIILSHLLDEGYAETQEQAEVIMVNMSEDWRESIILEQTLPSNYTDYKSPAVQASHARSMGSASRMRQMGMNATSVDPKDDAQSNLNAVKSGNGVAKPLSGTTIRSGAGKGFKVGDPGINIGSSK